MITIGITGTFIIFHSEAVPTGNSAPPNTAVLPCRMPPSGKIPTMLPAFSRSIAVRSAARSLFVRSIGKA